MQAIIHGLSNEEYHRGDPYREYLSSTQLKAYAKSPKYARYMLDHPQEETDAMRFGSLFHDLMASLARTDGDWFPAISDWKSAIAVFKPPVNENKGKPFGTTSNAYKDAYVKFLEESDGKQIVTQEDMELCEQMAWSLYNQCGSTSEQVRDLLRWGIPEVSIFHETAEGIKLKIRPDLLTGGIIADYKTTNSDDLGEDAINRMILNYDYHISAAMYVWAYHEATGEWVRFYLIIVSKVPPYDCVMVDMSNYAYHYLPDEDIVIPGPGAIEFKKLLGLHTRCTKADEWPGAETFIMGDRYRIMEIEPPAYYARRFIEDDIY